MEPRVDKSELERLAEMATAINSGNMKQYDPEMLFALQQQLGQQQMPQQQMPQHQMPQQQMPQQQMPQQQMPQQQMPPMPQQSQMQPQQSQMPQMSSFLPTQQAALPELQTSGFLETIPGLIQDPLVILCLFVLLNYSLSKDFVGKYSPSFAKDDIKGVMYRGIILVGLFVVIKLSIDYAKKK